MGIVSSAVLDDLGAEDLARLAERLMPYLPSEPAPTPDGWLNAQDAAQYLGLSINALHKFTAARTIPFEQESPGCRCWFKRSELDGWRRRN